MRQIFCGLRRRTCDHGRGKRGPTSAAWPTPRNQARRNFSANRDAADTGTKHLAGTIDKRSKLHHLAGAQDAVDVRKIVRRGDMRAGFGRVAFPVEARQIQNRHRHICQDAIAKSDDFYLAGAKGFPAASPPGY